jgi:hypothetical protein
VEKKGSEISDKGSWSSKDLEISVWKHKKKRKSRLNATSHDRTCSSQNLYISLWWQQWDSRTLTTIEDDRPTICFHCSIEQIKWRFSRGWKKGL